MSATAVVTVAHRANALHISMKIVPHMHKVREQHTASARGMFRLPHDAGTPGFFYRRVHCKKDMSPQGRSAHREAECSACRTTPVRPDSSIDESTAKRICHRRGAALTENMIAWLRRMLRRASNPFCFWRSLCDQRLSSVAAKPSILLRVR
jgi:hypothetical protein